MIKVKNFTKNEVSHFENDFYIPFKIKFYNLGYSPVNLCMISDKNSLLEISVDKKSGQLNRIILLMIEKSELVEELFSINKETISGTPIFDTSLWEKEQIVRLDFEMTMFIGKDFSRIIIGYEQPEKFYKIKNTYIGVTKDSELCEVVATNLSEKEICTIIESLEHTKKSRGKWAK